MACHHHLLDRTGRLLGLSQEEESICSPTTSLLAASSSSRTGEEKEECQRNPRRLLLSLDRLIYALPGCSRGGSALWLLCLVLLSSPLLLRVDGKYLEDCEKVSLPGSSSSDISLSCKLRTINSEFDKTNFSALSGDSIVSLTLECSNVLFYQSSLQAGSLAHLSRLQNLHIEHCKLSRLSPGVFSGLSLLKNLTIRTHNTAWPALSLDIASGVFSQLSQLEKIDISANNIWTFPDKLFCHAKSLEHLNVSLNRLQDISDLGFREREDKNSNNNNNNNSLLVAPNSRLPSPGFMISGGGCRLGLQVLDISFNRLILLPARGLASLSQLKELYLQGNEISMVADRALAGLKGLRVLNLTDNKVSGLPESLFHDSKEITEIYLQNNSLVSLPPRLFSGLEQLVVLDLSHNSLTSQWLVGNNRGKSTQGESSDKDDENNKANGSNATTSSTGDGADAAELTTNAITTTVAGTTELHPGVFEGLIRLVLLDLGHNMLTRLSPEPFKDLYSLQILDVQSNQIQFIEPSTFSSMNNLHTLILSHNKLTAIDATALNGLFVLSLLSLDNNEIADIHPMAFQNCTSLKDLNLNGNAFDRAPPALQNLTLLKTVDLGENMIDQLESPRLIGLPNLYGLRVTGNRVVNVSKDALKELPSLRVLNLARNRIQAVEKGAFDANTNLQAVRLDANFLQDISNLFADLPSLIWLNVSDNHLTWFDYALIPKQLQWLDLHKNEIADLGNYFHTNDLHLQTLDASFNRLTRIGPNTIPDSIEMLFLNDNLINTIEPDTFYNKANLSRVDIFANQIETLEIRALQLSPVPEYKLLPEFYIAGNPILCDCKMEWLQRLDKHLRQHPNVMDLDSVYCKLVYGGGGGGVGIVPLMEAAPSDFLCSYQNHCFKTCECCGFACDCENTCPDNCSCYHDATWMSNIVVCKNGFNNIPSRIPMDATMINLDGNDIRELTSHVFIGKKNLRVLYLNNTGIDRIQNNSFSGLKLLTVLHMEDNLLTELNGYEFEPLESIRELYLHNNQITFIANNTFSGLRMLEVLRIDNNRLTTFSMWTLSQNPYLVEIALSVNPYSCDCDYVSQAAPWIQSNVHKLMDASGVNCRLNGRSLSLVYMNGTKCSEITALSGASEAPETKLPPYLPLLAAVMAICLLIGSVFLAVCRRRSLKVWAAAKCPLNQCYQSPLDDEREKLYDAYVAYSQKDEVWVTQVLAAELQQQIDHPYRLCLHYKDFPVTSYLADTIVEAVESSKRTVLVLSKNFLQSEWCRFEFKSALHAALRGKRNRLLVVSLGDIPTKDLEPDLRVCLRSATVLSANDKLFWTKLRCALPEPRASYTARTLMTMSRPGSGGSSGSVGSAASVHNYTASSLGGASTLPLNISSDSSATSNHLHHFPHHHPPAPHHHHNSMTMSHHHHHHAAHPQHHFYNSSTLGTNGFIPNGNTPTSHMNGNVTANGTLPPSNHCNNGVNNNIGSNNSDNNHHSSNGNAPPVPLYVPPFPPPNRPPPPFPAPRRPPPPAPLWA